MSTTEPATDAPVLEEDNKPKRGWLSRQFESYGGITAAAAANISILTGTKWAFGAAGATLGATTLAVGGAAFGVSYALQKYLDNKKRAAAEAAGETYISGPVRAKALATAATAALGFGFATTMAGTVAPLLIGVSGIAMASAAINHAIDRRHNAKIEGKPLKFWSFDTKTGTKDGEPSLWRKIGFAGALGGVFTLGGLSLRDAIVGGDNSDFWNNNSINRTFDRATDEAGSIFSQIKNSLHSLLDADSPQPEAPEPTDDNVPHFTDPTLREALDGNQTQNAVSSFSISSPDPASSSAISTESVSSEASADSSGASVDDDGTNSSAAPEDGTTPEAPVEIVVTPEMKAFDKFANEYLGKLEFAINNDGVQNPKILERLAALQDIVNAHNAGEPINMKAADAHIKELGFYLLNDPCDDFAHSYRTLGAHLFALSADMRGAQGMIGTADILKTSPGLLANYHSTHDRLMNMTEVRDFLTERNAAPADQVVSDNADCFVKAEQGDYSKAQSYEGIETLQCEQPTDIDCNDKGCVATTHMPLAQVAVDTSCTLTTTTYFDGAQEYDMKAACSVPIAESITGAYQINATGTCEVTIDGQTYSDTAQCSADTTPVEKLSDMTPKTTASSETPLKIDASCDASLDGSPLPCTTTVTENMVTAKDYLGQLTDQGVHILPTGHVSAECQMTTGEIGIKDARRDGSGPLWLLQEYKTPTCDIHDETTKPGDTIRITTTPRGGGEGYQTDIVINMGKTSNTQDIIDDTLTGIFGDIEDLNPANNIRYYECGKDSCSLKPAI